MILQVYEVFMEMRGRIQNDFNCSYLGIRKAIPKHLPNLKKIKKALK